MSSKPTLYYVPGSPPARAVLLVAKALDLELDLKLMDFLAGEHLQAAFLKLNPQHTVPTLVDNGESLWDSHAISTYLISKYGKNDELYPKDLITRARIDQRLQFDTSILFPILKEVAGSFFFDGQYEVKEKPIADTKQAFEFLEIFLSAGKFVVGNNRTVADLSLITSVTQLLAIIPIDISNYPKIQSWINGFDELPYFEETNTKNLKDIIAFIDGIRARNKAAASSK